MPKKDNPTKNIKRIAENAGKTVNGLWVFMSILSIFLIIFYVINNRSGEDQAIQGEYSDLSEFGCEVTSLENVLIPDDEPLNTIVQISSIDYDNDVYQTELGKNGIPAILEPKYTNYINLDNCMRNEDEVIVVKNDDVIRVYPAKIINSHVLINDTIHGLPILVSKCNLCNYYQVYVREYRNEELFFGVSGLLYKNNDLIFDHKTESLWAQFDGIARVGTLTDASLETVPFEKLTYAEAKAIYPEAELVSFDTGFRRNYEYAGFDEFAQLNDVVTPVTNFSPEIPLKENIIAVEIDGEHYVASEERIYYSGGFEKKIAGKILEFTVENGNFNIKYDNESIPYEEAFWYVWYDFYPDSVIL